MSCTWHEGCTATIAVVETNSEYRVLTKVLTKRLEKTLEENHESKLDSEALLNDRPHPRRKPTEGEVHYEKACDSVQTQAVLTSLHGQGIEDVYIELLKEIYTNISMTVHIHKESNKINIRRGVRAQGDAISPKLFTAAVESLFRRLTRETRGLKVDGEYRSHLRYADDILICANTPHELQQ